MELGFILPWLQLHALQPYPEPGKYRHSPIPFLRDASVLILSLNLRLDAPDGFQSGFASKTVLFSHLCHS
jgi:hypothetical protein